MADEFGGLSPDSMLPVLIRLKLPWIDATGEVITSIDLLRDEDERERLGLSDRDAEELIRTVHAGKVKAETFEGYVLFESEYRTYRDLMIIELIWG